MKRIVIDMERQIEKHLLSGSSFSVDRRLERQGGNIYLDRTYVGHPSIASARTILIPSLHLWVMFWEGHGGPHPCRCYMHMARIRDEGEQVLVEDLYLDVIMMRDGRWQVLDIDEFRAAIADGELSQEQILASLAGLEHACHFVERSGGEIERYVYRLLEQEGA